MAFSMMYGTGFEMGSVDGLVIDADQNYASIDIAHTGSHGLKLSSGTFDSYIRFREVTGTPGELYVAVWHKWNNEEQYIYFRLDSGNIYLKYNGTYWDAYHSDDGLIASGSVATNNTEWQHVQVRLSINDSTGILQTKIDGIDDIDFSGDTRPGTASYVDYIELRAGQYGSSYWDDLCLGTGGWPSDIRFEALIPDGDTATIDWTGSDGDQVDNYALVDEHPSDTADYVESVLTGDQDKYTLGDFDITNKNPLAVILWALAKKDEADAHQLKLILDDGTEDVGTGQDLLTSYTYVHRLDETKPSGGDWTDAALDALIAGIESVIV